MSGWLFFILGLALIAVVYLDAPDSWLGKKWQRFNSDKLGFQKVDGEKLQMIAYICIFIVMALVVTSLVNDFRNM